MNAGIKGIFELPNWGAGLLTLMLAGFGAWGFSNINAITTRQAVQEERINEMKAQLDRIERGQQVQENLQVNAINKLIELASKPPKP